MQTETNKKSYALYCPSRNQYWNIYEKKWNLSIVGHSKDGVRFLAKFKHHSCDYALLCYFKQFGVHAAPVEMKGYDSWNAETATSTETHTVSDHPNYALLHELKIDNFSCEHLLVSLWNRNDFNEFNFIVENSKDFRSGKNTYDAVFKQKNCKVYYKWMAVKTEEQLIMAKLKHNIVRIIDLRIIRESNG